MNFNKQLYNHKLYSLDILTVSKKNQVAQHHVETEKISKNIHIEKQPLKKIERVRPKPFIKNKRYFKFYETNRRLYTYYNKN
jgi:hypothetical protein